MKALKLFFIILFILCSCNKEEQNNNKIIFKDDIGNTITLNKSPKRIITLAPNLTEIIFDLKLDKYLVGNTLYCNFPEQANKIEKVGDMINFDFEKIISLKPDLIFITVEGNTKEAYNKFNELGLKVFVSNPRNISGIKKTYLDIAKILGAETLAKINISLRDSLIAKISRAAKNYERKSVMYLVELQPLMLAGKNTFINEYLEICGLENIAKDVNINYPIFNREEILKRNPDIIIIPDDGIITKQKILELYPEWKNLKAINNNKVIFVNRDLFSRPGPRYADAVKELFITLHPQEKDLR
ncbi:ABC transporter substrate-binding protein [Rosettibacter firmus]|uniref:ABC transporter substrate-binding protein n=1 Tax=Rosettibacter firmus TaxID=3111522 RepID=UPI00336BBBE0